MVGFFCLSKSQNCVCAVLLMDWFLTVIYVIMVKNTPIRLIFRKKSGETAPQRGAKLSKRTQRSGSFDSCRKGGYLFSKCVL